MELKLLKLAIERLHDQVEQLNSEMQHMKQELATLQEKVPEPALEPNPSVITNLADEYMNIKEVQKTLGVCYNTLKNIVEKGHLKPIRINQRRIRYSKAEVINYLQSGGG